MIAVIILTYNEEMHIARAIESVSSFACEIFVVDSFSTDGTVEIAKSLGATVVQHPFVNQARQFQWALDNVPMSQDWIMRLDADEVVEPSLAAEIRSRLPKLGRDIVGVNLRRRHVFLGRFIRHGGRYPLILTRLWRRGHGRVEDRWMDEHMLVHGGASITFDAPFTDHNLRDLSHFTAKHNGYATREAVDVIMRRRGLTAAGTDHLLPSGTLQARAKRLMKVHVFDRMPFPISTLAYFLYRYVVLLGFLDGREGFIYHALQAYWYRLLVGARLLELERAIGKALPRDEQLRMLSRLTGLPLHEPYHPIAVVVSCRASATTA